MNIIKFIVFVLFTLCLANFISAQVLPKNQAEVERELRARGISEEVLRQALEKEGIDPDNIENLSPAQIIRLQEIISELESDTLNQRVVQDTLSQQVSNIPSSIETSRDTTKTEETALDTVPLVPDEVPVYGHNLMKSGNVKVFKQADRIKVSDSYILGPGDEISISIFGRSQAEEKYEIREDGYIRIRSGRQRVLLKGITLGSAKDKLYNIYSNIYSFNRGEFEATLNYSRTIEVGVYGEVNNPGSYTFDAINNVFNALVAVKGPTATGSVRKIRLNKSSGAVLSFDLYEFMSNPSVAESYYLDHNDIVFVPIQGKVVQFFGAIKRPVRFELLENEHLISALQYAGGLMPSSYKKSFRLIRYSNNQRIAINIPYEDLLRTSEDFRLMDGDEIYIDTVDNNLTNFVEVNGEVVNPGFFERRPGMKISEVIDLAGLKPESRTDVAPLMRLNQDSSISFQFLNLDLILAGRNDAMNIELDDGDEIIIWAKSRFSDIMTVEVTGAVREPGSFPYDRSQQVRILEGITLAGGLRRDAGNIGIIHRTDPLKPNYKKYIRVNIDDLNRSPDSDQNIALQPFDKLEILSENLFSEVTYITVNGAVNNPGEFQYGEGMSIADALALARGFKLAALTNNIEISRIVIRDNQPTKTVIANLSVNRDFHLDSSDDANFILQPFDNLFVRYVPEFELQQNVQIVGEVQFPGPYSIIDDNERISSLVERAGGLTIEAFPAGAKLFRKEDNIGYIVMRLDEVMEDRNSRYNYILKDGDRIEIPKQRDFVTIRGATRVREVVVDDVIGENREIKVAYHKGKNAKFYIDFYAGGIAENGEKKLIFVEHPNGEIKQTRRKFIFGWSYPDVRNGSVITVGAKPPELPPEEQAKEEVDWTRVLGDSVAQAMSILTLILLIQRLE